MRYLTIIGTVY